MTGGEGPFPISHFWKENPPTPKGSNGVCGLLEVKSSVKSARWGGGDGRGGGVKCMRFARCFEPWAQKPCVLRGFRSLGLKNLMFCDVFGALGSKTLCFARFWDKNLVFCNVFGAVGSKTSCFARCSEPWAQKHACFVRFLEPYAQNEVFGAVGSKTHAFCKVFGSRGPNGITPAF